MAEMFFLVSQTFLSFRRAIVSTFARGLRMSRGGIRLPGLRSSTRSRITAETNCLSIV